MMQDYGQKRPACTLGDCQRHQLHAARYAFHKVRCKMYGDAVRQNLMGVEEARERYRLAMLNYDELIKSSANGSVTDADQADMDKGFVL